MTRIRQHQGSSGPARATAPARRVAAALVGVLVAIGGVAVAAALLASSASASPYVLCRNGVPIPTSSTEVISYGTPTCLEQGPAATVPGSAVAAGGTLPTTGGDPTQLLALGFVLLALGGAAAVGSRRRPSGERVERRAEPPGRGSADS